jgi:glycosyltransferase involved in cell wall biosynthesis
VTMNRSYSVVIASYNRASMLGEAVQSVLDQTLPAHEVIVVLDGSTDGSREQLAARFPDVRVADQSNLGVSVARNHGISLTTGDWIAFLDDDDLWHREKLAQIDRYLDAHPDCRAVNHPAWVVRFPGGPDALYAPADFNASSLAECHLRALDATPKSDFSHLHITGRSYQALLERNCGSLSSTVVERTVLITAGSAPSTHVTADDWMMFLNIARLVEWHTLDERLLFVRLYDRVLSADGHATLSAKVAAWYGGRAAIHPTNVREVQSLLRAFGPAYRAEIRGVVWLALRRGDRVGAVVAYRVGRVLLPRARDRWYVLSPPGVPALSRTYRRYLDRFGGVGS